MTTPIYDSEWKTKLAANMRPSRPEIERTFAEQAFSFIAAKAGPLMEDNVCLGFELIHGNDDNTRLIGAFVFRLDQIWLAPVFFINGQIKGDQFLWDAKQRLFKPLCSEWSESIVRDSRLKSGERTGMLKDRTSVERNSGIGYDLGTVARVPHMLNKTAGVGREAITGKEATSSLLSDEDVHSAFCDVADYEAGALLQHAVKTASVEMLDAMFAGVAANPSAAELVLQMTGGNIEKLAGEYAERRAQVVKTASAEPTGVRFSCGTITKTAADSPAFNASMRHGFEVTDYRDEKSLVQVVESDVNLATLTPGQVVEIPLSAETATASALIADGVSLLPLEFTTSSFYPALPCGAICGGGEKAHVHAYFFADKTMARYSPENVHGIEITGETDGSVDSTTQWIEKNSEEPQKGKVYVIVNDTGTSITDYAHAIDDITDKGAGVKLLSVCRVSSESTYVDTPFQVMVDKNRAKSDLPNGIIGNDSFFLPMATESTPDNGYHEPCHCKCMSGKKLKTPALPIPGRTMFELICQNNGLVVSATRADEHYQLKLTDGTKTKKASVLILDHPVKLAAALCHTCDMSATDAMSFIERIDTTPQGLPSSIAIHPTHSHMKLAATSRPAEVMQGYNVREPSWQPQYDSMNGVLMDWPREFQTSVSRSTSGTQAMQPNDMLQMLINESSVNGNMRPQDPEVLPADELMKLDPHSIERVIADRNLMHATEHGIIASLVRTYDVGRVISELIPEIEIGVDRIGRLCFLMIWKPSDFERLYGSDELVQRETQLSGNFRSLGMLVLDLKKRPNDAEGMSASLQ